MMTHRRRRAAFAWILAVLSVVGMAVNEALARTWGVSDEGETALFVTVFVGSGAGTTVAGPIPARGPA